MTCLTQQKYPASQSVKCCLERPVTRGYSFEVTEGKGWGRRPSIGIFDDVIVINGCLDDNEGAAFMRWAAILLEVDLLGGGDND